MSKKSYKFNDGDRVYYFNGYNSVMSGTINGLWLTPHYPDIYFIKRDKKYIKAHPKNVNVELGFSADKVKKENMAPYTKSGLDVVKKNALSVLNNVFENEINHFKKESDRIIKSQQEISNIKHCP